VFVRLLIRNLPIGRVCVPVNPDEVAQFDPEAVPTVGQLLRELDEQTLDGSDERAGSYHKGTIAARSDCKLSIRLGTYVFTTVRQMLDAHIRGLMQETREAKLGM
jgi:DNA primase small subunit